MKRLLPLLTIVLMVTMSGCILVPKKGVEVPGDIIVTGTISAYDEPVAGATITVQETGATGESDENGKYSVKVPEGTYTFVVSRVGYHEKSREVTVSKDANDPVDFELLDAPYYDTDFSDEPTGLLTDVAGVREVWTINAPAEPKVVESPARTGKSIQMTGVATGYKDSFHYILPETLTDQVTVETWIMPTGTQRSLGITVSDSDSSLNTAAVSLYVYTDGDIAYYDTAFRRLAGVKYTPGEWLHLKIVVDIPNQTYDIYVNGSTTPVATADFRNPKTEITHVGFFMYGAGTMPDPVYIDSIKIRRRDV